MQNREGSPDSELYYEDDVYDLDHEYGYSVEATRIYFRELDQQGQLRLNPLWMPLEEFKLDISNRNAVWLYAVNEWGQVSLGVEKFGTVVTREQLDDMVIGMGSRQDGLTQESLLAAMSGLGHPTVAAGFDEETGVLVRGDARISGEFRWSKSRKSWIVSDNSGRYMGPEKRQGFSDEDRMLWLTSVAGDFSRHLGIEVQPSLAFPGIAATAALRAVHGSTNPSNSSAPLPVSQPHVPSTQPSRTHPGP
ncbi:hypothetical protein [Streptomyces capillispiralis]|uniref:Uncharacterized protein n=1 Tax=Streptomyces capillispiralis TaxID=68182 RepID=A0A561SGJ9_9ACTN|nr:hypothetical protein [Streptomyces capillispiralis]TWF73978.1 hypothetical protein FHX78_1210 [Streptomyces capillispiralis]GHH96333.1 hypothetical protein GCM10017779_67900 [Streptomyces capillispiralis]